MSYASEEGVLAAQINAASMAFATEEMRQAPHVLIRPCLIKDGNAWLAIYGDLPTGCVGTGSTPEEAMKAFDAAWRGGVCMGVAMSCRKHPNHGTLMGLFQEAQNILFPQGDQAPPPAEREGE